jgi:hypothetical protein
MLAKLPARIQNVVPGMGWRGSQATGLEISMNFTDAAGRGMASSPGSLVSFHPSSSSPSTTDPAGTYPDLRSTSPHHHHLPPYTKPARRQVRSQLAVTKSTTPKLFWNRFLPRHGNAVVVLTRFLLPECAGTCTVPHHTANPPIKAGRRPPGTRLPLFPANRPRPWSAVAVACSCPMSMSRLHDIRHAHALARSSCLSVRLEWPRLSSSTIVFLSSE